MKPDPRSLVEIPRRIDLIDVGLRGVIRDLISGKSRWPLYLWGDVGVGKTAAALCMCDHVPDSWYATAKRLVANMLTRNDYLDIKSMSDKRFAVLDELGARDDNPGFACEVVQAFADVREKHNRVAVYVSNVDIGGISKLYDPRIASRLSCGTVHRLEGGDRRR